MKLDTYLAEVKARSESVTPFDSKLNFSSHDHEFYISARTDIPMLLKMVEFLDQEIKSAIKAYNIKLYNHHEHLEKIMEKFS